MGRSRDAWMEQQEREWEVAAAAAEAAHFAVPETLAESLEINRLLKEQLSSLTAAFAASRSPKEVYKERLIGFVLGVGASLVAALIWWLASRYVQVLGAA